MNKSMILHELSVVHDNIGGGVQALVDIPDRKYLFRIEIPDEYKEYICTDYSDPVVLMCLEYAMARGFDVVCEQPMSEDLYYKLTNFFIPIIAKNTKTFHSIKLTAKTLPAPHFNGNAVGTGLSCGVDSLNTVQKYLNFSIQKYKLTHLVFLNNGALGSSEYYESVKIFEQERLHVERAAKEIGLPLLAINTSMVDLYAEIQSHRANNNEGLKIASAIYTLRKLFSVYFIA